MRWVRAVDRWNLMDDDEIIGAVTHEVLSTRPALFEYERGLRGWPEIPPPIEPMEPEWTPLSLVEVIRILDGDTPYHWQSFDTSTVEVEFDSDTSDNETWTQALDGG